MPLLLLKEGNEGQVTQARGVPPGNQGSQQGTAVSLHSAVAVSLCLHLKPPSQPSSYIPATSSLFVVYALQSLHLREPPHLPITAGKEFPPPQLVMFHCTIVLQSPSNTQFHSFPKALLILALPFTAPLTVITEKRKRPIPNRASCSHALPNAKR